MSLRLIKKCKKNFSVASTTIVSRLGCLIELKLFTKFFFKLILNVSAFYLDKQKSFINKKIFFKPSQYQNKKALFTDSIFPEGFV